MAKIDINVLLHDLLALSVVAASIFIKNPAHQGKVAPLIQIGQEIAGQIVDQTVPAQTP